LRELPLLVDRRSWPLRDRLRPVGSMPILNPNKLGKVAHALL
jgi:hypothetical protein